MVGANWDQFFQSKNEPCKTFGAYQGSVGPTRAQIGKMFGTQKGSLGLKLFRALKSSLSLPELTGTQKGSLKLFHS